MTGHRSFDDPERVCARVDAALDRLGLDRGGMASTVRDVTVWSSLAEGADRLVAERTIARGASLVVVLPLEPADYRLDFSTAQSQAEFDRLLALADSVHVAEPGEAGREAAYEAAGLAVLDAVQVLVALWDGEPGRGRGGTTEIVSEARRRGIDVVVVPVTRDNV